jgi:hypothetical protein
MTRFAGMRIVGLTAVAFLAGAMHAWCASAYTYVTIDNPNDANFNQALGINSGNVIVGYDGDGTIEPNKGYVVVPSDHFSDENFPNSAQTQVTGINNEPVPGTVGFYIDASGNNFGFFNKNGNFVSVKNPHTGVSGGIMTNQLLGINDNAQAAGFYLDAAGNSHGYIYDVKAKTFTELSLPFGGVVSVQATGINDSGTICGFYVDKKNVTRGFLGTQGNFVSVSAPGAAKSLTFLGSDNNGLAVGATTGGAGVSHGFVYQISSGTFTFVDVPGASDQPAFGVSGVTVNGVNDNGDLVGFFSDGTHVNGFAAFLTAVSAADGDN